jgi:hypothetical protein
MHFRGMRRLEDLRALFRVMTLKIRKKHVGAKKYSLFMSDNLRTLSVTLSVRFYFETLKERDFRGEQEIKEKLTLSVNENLRNG